MMVVIVLSLFKVKILKKSVDNIREEYDFYPTPPDVTKSFLRHEKLEGMIWEPACGLGDMSKVIEEQYGEIRSTDLIDRGYGTGSTDFLNFSGIKSVFNEMVEKHKMDPSSFDLQKHLELVYKVDTIITNPPFKYFVEFVNQSKIYADKKICMLGRTNLIGFKDSEFWNDKEFPLKKVYQMDGRVLFNKNKVVDTKGGELGFAWFVFEKGYSGSTSLEWIRIGDK